MGRRLGVRWLDGSTPPLTGRLNDPPDEATRQAASSKAASSRRTPKRTLVVHSLSIARVLLSALNSQLSTDRSGSDIIHLLGLLGEQFVESVLLGLLGERFPQLAPNLAHATAGSPFVIAAQSQHFAVDHDDDIVQRNLIGWTRERVASLNSSAARDQSAVAQLAEDLRQEILGHFFSPREMLDLGQLGLPVKSRQFSENPARIVDFGGNFHGRGENQM